MQALAGLCQDKHEWQAFIHYCQVPPSTLQARQVASGDMCLLCICAQSNRNQYTDLTTARSANIRLNNLTCFQRVACIVAQIHAVLLNVLESCSRA